MFCFVFFFCNITFTHQHSSREIQLELLSDRFDHKKIQLEGWTTL